MPMPPNSAIAVLHNAQWNAALAEMEKGLPWPMQHELCLVPSVTCCMHCTTIVSQSGRLSHHSNEKRVAGHVQNFCSKTLCPALCLVPQRCAYCSAGGG